jgi:hypothetical protein
MLEELPTSVEPQIHQNTLKVRIRLSKGILRPILNNFEKNLGAIHPAAAPAQERLLDEVAANIGALIGADRKRWA